MVWNNANFKICSLALGGSSDTHKVLTLDLLRKGSITITQKGLANYQI